ncbi:hypothetical protein HDU98_002774 [Podochytrium sp. JEL0797]|nr:hypothetical protein HDU98_002774 [Podochytrium sp. JEL0797]
MYDRTSGRWRLMPLEMELQIPSVQESVRVIQERLIRRGVDKQEVKTREEILQRLRDHAYDVDSATRSFGVDPLLESEPMDEFREWHEDGSDSHDLESIADEAEDGNKNVDRNWRVSDLEAKLELKEQMCQTLCNENEKLEEALMSLRNEVASQRGQTNHDLVDERISEKDQEIYRLKQEVDSLRMTRLDMLPELPSKVIEQKDKQIAKLTRAVAKLQLRIIYDLLSKQETSLNITSFPKDFKLKPEPIAISITTEVNMSFSEAGAKATMITSNEPPNTITSAELAALVKDAADPAKCQIILEVCEKRLTDGVARNWRQIYKALLVVDGLIRSGAPNAAKFARTNLYPLLTALLSFYFEDEETDDAALNKACLNGKPPAGPSPIPHLPMRIWTDLSGSFKVEARFLSISGNNMVTLERPAGDQMGIMMDKMSSADLDYILGLQQQGIDVRKPAAITRVPSNQRLIPERPPTPSTAAAVSVSADSGRNSTTTSSVKSNLPPGFIIPATALKIDLTPGGKLGSGTSGFVRKAVYAGNAVAVKIISVRHLTKPQREAVIKEAEIMSRIVHPNAVRLFGVMIEEGLGVGMVMELLPHGCLKTYIEANPLPSLAQRVRLARDVSHAMAYLHDTLNMVHRDLKGLNILLDDGGVFMRAKVCDFGFAHVKSLGMDSSFWNGSSSAATSSEFSGGAIRGLKMQAAISMGSMTVNGGMGTPLWMAPELFDMNALISKPADVYAFTVVMTEIFSWAGPYCIPYEKIIPIMQHVIGLVQSGRRPELALTADVPQSIRSLIEAGWDQNPEMRPTFREMTRLLERAKAEADYASIYTLSPMIRDSTGALSPSPGSQSLDNMNALARSLPPQSSPTSASAPILTNTYYNFNNGSNGMSAGLPIPPSNHAQQQQQQQHVFNPFRDPVGVPQPPIGRVKSQGTSIPTLNQMQANNNASNAQSFSVSPGRKGFSMANLQQPLQQPQQQQLPPQPPQARLRPPSRGEIMQRPMSLPMAELQLPGSKHAMLWDVEDTAVWLVMMGENPETVKRCKELKIDGKKLLMMKENELGDRLGVLDYSRRRRLSELLDDYRSM